jgi:hypothetical protein
MHCVCALNFKSVLFHMLSPDFFDLAASIPLLCVLHILHFLPHHSTVVTRTLHHLNTTSLHIGLFRLHTHLLLMRSASSTFNNNTLFCEIIQNINLPGPVYPPPVYFLRVCLFIGMAPLAPVCHPWP